MFGRLRNISEKKLKNLKTFKEWKMKIRRVYHPEKKSKLPLQWKYLRNKAAICIIKNLINGEELHPIMNNPCKHTRLSNVIMEIRKVIGHDQILNKEYDEVKGVYYALVRKPENIRKLNEIKAIISAYLYQPLKGKR